MCDMTSVSSISKPHSSCGEISGDVSQTDGGLDEIGLSVCSVWL
jgi:hypothetical protein